MRLAVLGLVLCLGACGAAQRAQLQKASAACQAQFSVDPGQIVARENCLNDALLQTFPNNALTPLIVAERRALAERVQTGKQTYAEANVDYQRTIFQAQQELSRSQSQRAAAAAAILSTMPQYHNTSCYGTGNFVNCSGY